MPADLARRPRGARALGVASTAGVFACVLAILDAHASAQRVTVEDSWAAAEARMESEPAPSYDGDLERPARVEPTWRERRSRRRARRRDERRARLEADRRHRELLGEHAERARQPFGGPLRVDLRGGGDLAWVWLDAYDAARELPHAPTLCVGGCTLHLRPGSYQFGLRDVRLRGAVSGPLRVDASGVLTAEYDSGVVRRRVGKLLAFAGSATIVGVLLSSFIREMRACGLFSEEACEAPDMPELYIGAPLGALALGAGVTLVLTARPRLEVSLRRRVPAPDPAW